MMYLRAQLAVSPGKTAALGGLAIILVIAVIVQLRGGPSSADASVLVPTNVVMSAPPAVVEQADPRTPFTAPSMQPLPDVEEQLARDLFAIMWDRYPAPQNPGDGNQSGPKTDIPEEEEEQLRLDATFLHRGAGEGPSAMINGQLVHKGDRIGRFVVQEIQPRSVLLRSDSMQIVLQMR